MLFICMYMYVYKSGDDDDDGDSGQMGRPSQNERTNDTDSMDSQWVMQKYIVILWVDRQIDLKDFLEGKR